MLLLIGLNRMARVAGFGRYSCVLATVGGRRSVMAVLTPATNSASLAGAPKAYAHSRTTMRHRHKQLSVGLVMDRGRGSLVLVWYSAF